MERYPEKNLREEIENDRTERDRNRIEREKEIEREKLGK